MVRIQMPLAWPVVLSGIRVSVLIMISIAAVAAIISDLGFGKPLLDGLSRLGGAGSFAQVVVGTVGPLVIAAVFEIVFVVVKRLTTPRGIRV
jgi:osmoprotectant transport system permease protein